MLFLELLLLAAVGTRRYAHDDEDHEGDTEAEAELAREGGAGGGGIVLACYGRDDGGW